MQQLTLDYLKTTKAFFYMEPANQQALENDPLMLDRIAVALDVISEKGLKVWAAETVLHFEFISMVREVYKANMQVITEAKNKAAYTVTPEQKATFEAGAIVVDTWGWEQTNKDFFCIVSRKGQFVTLLPMKKHTSEETTFMSYTCMPNEIDYSAEPIRKKIKCSKLTGEELGFSFRDGMSGGWCSLWKGNPETISTYA